MDVSDMEVQLLLEALLACLLFYFYFYHDGERTRGADKKSVYFSFCLWFHGCACRLIDGGILVGRQCVERRQTCDFSPCGSHKDESRNISGKHRSGGQNYAEKHVFLLLSHAGGGDGMW